MPGPAFGFRRSSVVIGAVILFVLAGLYATDRALTQASRERLRVDAAESAALVESFLSQRAEALAALRAVYADGQASIHRAALAEYTIALTDFLPGIRRLWVADSSGRIVDDVAVTGGAHLPAADMDTIHTLGLDSLAARARLTSRPLISAPGQLFGDVRGVVMMMPLCSQPRRSCAGFIAALLSSDVILATALRHAPTEQTGLLILAGTDTIASRDWPTSEGDEMRVTFPAPDGREWQVLLRHDTNIGHARSLLWTIGLIALAALAWGMVRERREAVYAAERSRELERLSTEALRANRAKSEFLANVSHELRTPLNAIVGFVDLLRDGVYGELAPRQVAPVERIAASAGHLRHLVDQVLDIAKMAAGRLEVHQESVDLRPFVFDVATEVEPLVSEKELAISLSVPATLPRVRTDPAHLRQILVNLIGNAVKYTPAGRIEVKARFVDAALAGESTTPAYAELRAQAPDPTRAWIALQVIDTGIGIAPADHARIFEEFEQVNAGPRGDSMHRGTGLGLPISRRLARLLGGEVTVRSALGKGSTFTAWIPVDRGDIRAAPHRTTPTATPVIGPSGRA
ncbi:MAG: HAMP domain-containing histidine kinase [Gemmatimonadaceae bacterium]|nr:HAMP domain-containing histidine kinase [Gemmatimonadaceae bacterium]NUQ92227.1 HAMP domain-containing histidine kinase [Gemmatimonadaceae bacterium]NUR20148.1 HAMP domain-containing histidine kinase [Gemmatimonadaceae bacterium]NUS96679.1 HAMP domain-containing histidine kinase [Gemmatimonadaceae bacterium]